MRIEITDLKLLADKNKRYATLVEKQRDDAVALVAIEKPLLPWYVWSGLGALAVLVGEKVL